MTHTEKPLLTTVWSLAVGLEPLGDSSDSGEAAEEWDGLPVCAVNALSEERLCECPPRSFLEVVHEHGKGCQAGESPSTWTSVMVRHTSAPLVGNLIAS